MPYRENEERSQRQDGSDRLHNQAPEQPPYEPKSPENALEDIDQRIRINELREKAREAGGGDMDDWTAVDCPLDLQEAFWESVVAWETAPEATYVALLAELDVDTPAPETLSDDDLHQVLWCVIRGLASINVYLSHTDHLSDRDLYGLLWGDIMRQPVKHVSTSELWHCELDLLGGCSREDLITLQTYYPDEWCLGDWDTSFLGPKPEPLKPEYDRDRRLPRDIREST
jgi:hypothetical protein